MSQVQKWITLHDTDAETTRKQGLQERYVSIRPPTSYTPPGIAYLDATVDVADAAHLEETITRVAEVLKAGGLEGERDELRSIALGKLAHPAQAAALLGETLPTEAGSCKHGAELIIRTTDHDLRSGRGGELEGFGGLTHHHLTELLAGCAKVTVRPVIDLTEPMIVATYKPSPELSWKVKERDRYELFPYSNRSSRSRFIDEDHTIPSGNGGQTADDNLASLTRKIHRARTFAGFVIEQTSPGVLHWRTPAGQQFWTNAHGTWTHQPPEACINDPDTTTTEVLARLLQIIAARPTHPPMPKTATPMPTDDALKDDPPPF